MKKSIHTKKMISSLIITIMLSYFMVKTISSKIIFVPFLVCSISMLGKNIALVFDKRKLAIAFSRLFALGFLLFWFGFLVVADCMSIRDKNYSVLLFTVPFWLVGFYFIKRKLLNTEEKNDGNSKIDFGTIVSAGLVIIALLAGILLLLLGVRKSEGTMIFAGLFFVLGSFAFILFALLVKGCFDNLKVDVFGVYVGVVFVIIGCGIIAIVYGQTNSFIEMIRRLGLWIAIPVLMISTGVLQVVRSLRNRKK